jgi:hypothetical protein
MYSANVSVIKLLCNSAHNPLIKIDATKLTNPIVALALQCVNGWTMLGRSDGGNVDDIEFDACQASCVRDRRSNCVENCVHSSIIF